MCGVSRRSTDSDVGVISQPREVDKKKKVVGKDRL